MKNDEQLIYEAYEGAEWIDIDDRINRSLTRSDPHEYHTIPHVGLVDDVTLKVLPGEGYEEIGTGERVTYTISMANPDPAGDPLNIYVKFRVRGVVSKIDNENISVHIVEVREAPTIPRGADWETGIEGN